MKSHKPLQWICDNLIFLPESGPKLKGKKIGNHILSFQEKVITEALDKDGNPKKNVFLGFSRKIAKSSLYSWIFNYFLENKEGFNMVGLASTFTQSDIIYGLIAQQIRLNSKIKTGNYKITRERLQNTERHNNLYKIFSEASSNLGMLSVSAVIADEVGAMKSRENLNSIMSGLAMAQTDPLLLFASNRPELPSHWSTEYLKTLKADKDWAFFDYSAPMKADVFSEKAKCQANPFYAEYKKTKNPLLKGVVKFVDKESDRGRRSAENLNVYRRFQLGQAVSAKAYQWVDVEDIKIASEKVLKNKDLRCILSFDLALSNDFCSCLIILFNEKTEDIYLYPFLHLANIKNRRPTQQKLFEDWDSAGFIKIQRNESIDKSFFITEVKSFLKKHNLSYEAHVWDKNLSTGWTEEFGDNPVLYRGTAYELAHAIRFVEARSKDGKLHFIGENPCLKWMYDCAICSQKSKGYTLLDRGSRFDSIDGAVATVLGTKYFIEKPRSNFTTTITF